VQSEGATPEPASLVLTRAALMLAGLVRRRYSTNRAFSMRPDGYTRSRSFHEIQVVVKDKSRGEVVAGGQRLGSQQAGERAVRFAEALFDIVSLRHYAIRNSQKNVAG